jgi:hypothetical protein
MNTLNSRAFLFSALIAGVLIGVFSEAPILSLGNVLCFLWIWVGGALGVFLYRRMAGETPALTPLQGALIGLVSGLVGGLVGTGLRVVFESAGYAAAMYIDEAMPQVAKLMRETLDRTLESGWPHPNGVLLGLACALGYSSLFGALGGWLTTTNIWKTPTGEKQ